MGAAGILRPDERTELIEGEIITMPPIGPEHADNVSGLIERFVRWLGDRARIRGQSPIRLPSGSEPEPDVVLARLRLEGYRDRHPEPEDVLLLIEVSDTTLSFDRGRKLLLYAQAGIREVWIVNLQVSRLQVYREPTPLGYRQTLLVPRDGQIAPLAFPDFTILCRDLIQ